MPISTWGILFKQETPLHRAAWEGHEEVTRLLIQNKAEVDVKGDYDQTPLHYASIYGREKIAETLLQNKANPNSRDSNQNTPLHTAAYWGYPKVVEVLFNHGVDKTLKNNDNETALQVAQNKKSFSYRENDFNSVISLLEEQKWSCDISYPWPWQFSKCLPE